MRSGTLARRLVRLRALLLAAALLSVEGSLPAAAQVGSDRYSSIVIEAASGNVLSAANADEVRYPASLTKLMTLYMTFEALRDRRIALSDPVAVSVNAASMSPSKLGLLPGSRLTVQDAILGLVTKSANDAAAALGEMLGGDEDRFAQMMTLRARALGMTRTVYRNASGLPDYDQITTARDLAVLARHLVLDFPAYYGYFSTPSFEFHGRVILNHDRMLQTYPGADGMKTGYIEASGHNLVTSAVHSGVRLIGVVLGARSNTERDIHMAALLDDGFDHMDVPPEARPVQVASRMPGLLSSAQAAPVYFTRRGMARYASRSGHWGVQVGTYGSRRAAREAAGSARRHTDAGAVRLEQIALNGRSAWRAQLGGLTQADAQDACAAISRKRTGCFLVRRGAGQLASR
ncbi:MAG: D-alanyl-D-alanine carboxypeptidase [Acetobacteraceae bacterium]|nr:D-alanyl-D-alanine carboxypeptidase [Acetobacteraceae bacterium]